MKKLIAASMLAFTLATGTVATATLSPAAFAATATAGTGTITGTVTSDTTISAGNAYKGVTITESVDLTKFTSGQKITLTAYLVPMVNGAFAPATSQIASATSTATIATNGESTQKLSIKVDSGVLAANTTYGVLLSAKLPDGTIVNVDDTKSQVITVSPMTASDQLTIAKTQLNKAIEVVSNVKSAVYYSITLLSALVTVASYAKALVN